MEDLTADREAAIRALAVALDVPEELLRVPPVPTPQERAERDAALLGEVDAACAEAARVIGPRLIAQAGLDPERYELVYAREGVAGGDA